ncbi:hypothetical protein S7711_00641 [Stachybotrys chartarum IBT 7711]|uniref:Myosin class II heavy chain n=1 Tax=Stachybotrys chartarum (strain CBS 109288 / IBT 7711) TaxID=1280523 RepID=A0A084ATZ2_STACB|nr:hypothetical protein S7711_00641 [Stachybotrys chartarum IBT 7711]
MSFANLASSGQQVFANTSSPSSPTPPPPRAFAQDGLGKSRSSSSSPPSPALSTASTADGGDDLSSSPILPALPAPRLPERALEHLRTPPSVGGDEFQFGTASWGSPYPRTDHNLRRQSFSSEASEDSPIHRLAIDTPFLRPPPELSQPQAAQQSSISAAAAVLANRVRRQPGGFTEEWIRTHTASDLNTEPRLWFSDGSESEHSSLSGSDVERDLETPKAPSSARPTLPPSQRRHSRGRSSVETLKDGGLIPSTDQTPTMEMRNSKSPTPDVASTASDPTVVQDSTATRNNVAESSPRPPSTPTRAADKPLPKEPSMTPRLKKKVPWKERKNIFILLPRDDERGLPGKAPMPLSQEETNRMFASWKELGYSVDGFDLVVEGFQPWGTSDSQSRHSWPDFDEVAQEHAQRIFKVTLPDLNAWKNYVNELQEAKLRALGVSLAPEPDIAQSISPPTTVPSRQASVQYPPLPFSPPVPTSSASSNHAVPGFPFPASFVPGLSSASHSPGISSVASPGPFGGMPSKYSRQSISFPSGASPFQSPPAWQNQGSTPQGMNRMDSPSLSALNGNFSPQSPFGMDGFQPTGSPAFNMHQRTHSLQYPMLPHQQILQHQQSARASPRLQEVREAEEEEEASKSPSKTPEPPKQNSDVLQAEIDDAEYHLEESLRNQLEHEDYDPLAQAQRLEPPHRPPVLSHSRQSSNAFPIPERFANDSGEPLVLHHPRPHSRGHSLSQNFFRDHHEVPGSSEHSAMQKFAPLSEIVEGPKGDDSYEIETNPSNLGTPVQDFDLPAAFGRHQKSMSTASNPWNDATSIHSNGTRRSSHASKPSLSGLNVQAAEFKFNPAKSFTPGLYNFSSNSFQPSVFQAGFTEPVPPAFDLHQFQPMIQPEVPSFVPSQSHFSFSASGPKFRPDAPAFTPFQSASASVTSPAANTIEDTNKRNDSIFGHIDIASDFSSKSQKTRAIPIIRPTASSPVNHPKTGSDDDVQDGPDGRLMDESRVKRARSSAPDDDDVPLFAEQPTGRVELGGTEVSQSEQKEEASLPEDVSAEGDLVAIDTSMSSVTSDRVDETKATTAAPSESSQADQATDEWPPYVFRNKADIQSFDEARPSGDARPVQKRPFHKKSLSATAQPFLPGAPAYAQEDPELTEEEQLEETPAPASPTPQPAAVERSPSPVQVPAVEPPATSKVALPPRKPKGLAASRFARTPTPPVQEAKHSSWTDDEEDEEEEEDRIGDVEQQGVVPAADAIVPSVEASVDVGDLREPTFEEIDAVMQQMETDPSMGVMKLKDAPNWQPVLDVHDSVQYDFQPPLSEHMATSTSPAHQHHNLPEAASPPRATTELEDPFVDPPVSANLREPFDAYGDQEPEHAALSDWEAAFSEDEQDKLEQRAQFFDGRVSDLVDTLLASRLEPLEKTLVSIQHALTTRMRRTPSTLRDRRSISAELQHSDADDEDEEPVPRRSMSPQRDRRLAQIRLAVTEALAAQQRSFPTVAPDVDDARTKDASAVLKALEELREHVSISKSDLRSEDLRSIVEDAVQSRMTQQAVVEDAVVDTKTNELEARIADLEQRLYFEQSKVEKEVTERRAAEDLAAELNRKLQAAETRVEVEIINRSVFDQRVNDLEDRLRHQEDQCEREVNQRRAAEDRLSEVQRLLRISSEEENRLREVVEEREHRIKSLEQTNGKSTMKLALLQAAQDNAAQTKSELNNKIVSLEADLRNVRQDNHNWRTEAERNEEAAHRSAAENANLVEENKHLQKSLSTLTTQLEENERLRESWRTKFLSLQEDMSQAAREVAAETAHRVKREQSFLARQEVLDARLQAEAKTRERLEIEMERLQNNERSGMRAVNECKRLEDLNGELRTENHKLQEAVYKHKREVEEAKDSGATEAKRARMVLQTELEAASAQVDLIREEMEEQNAKFRAELDSVRLEADTAKARNEMLLEELETTKTKELQQLREKHQNDLEDLQARHERQLNTAVDDSQKTEQHLLERLSLSSSKIEHLQDRVVLLEEKVDIAKQAAAAAAQAAKLAGNDPGSVAAAVRSGRRDSARAGAPEKISPQALRESIMVLQEQLQAREQRIEELEQSVTKHDPDAALKITKRDDEISWLRELLAVRHSDLQDIIAALSAESYDREGVKDAVIRLKANLQMEEQERERAMNGGSAINLPNIAQTIQAATPRVAQTIGPIAAAFGNWRKGNQASFRSISGALNSPASTRSATPLRSPNPPNSLLGGLMTPPASGLRQTPPAEHKPQPTAFQSTGRRFTSQSSVPNRARGGSSASRRSESLSIQQTPPRRQERPEPVTPPMMVAHGYDSDAQPGDFDENDFFEDED